MKRTIFTLLVVLALALAAGLMAQSSPQPLPPSQQVDQSGKPEQPGHPDVDVDVGKNANNGVMDVDVKRNGDADTKAQRTDVTDQAAQNTNTTGTTGAYDNTNTAGDNASMPNTASDTPLVGLIGLLSLAGALALRANR